MQLMNVARPVLGIRDGSLFHLAAVLVTMLLVPTMLHAQQDPGAAGPPPETPPTAGEQPAGPEAATGPGDEIADASTENTAGTSVPDARAVPPPDVELSFQNAKIELIVKWLGEVTGKTIIKHPKVQCQLNVMSSKKRTLDQALRMVYTALALEGFAAVETVDTIYLVPEADAAKIAPEWVDGDDELNEGKQRVVRILPLEYATAANLQAKLKNVLSAEAKIEVDEQANRLIVTDYAHNMHLAQEFVRELDVPAVGDSRTDVITLEHAKAEELATILAKVFGGSTGGDKPKEKPTSGGARFIPDPVTNRLIVTATQGEFSEIEGLIRKLDTEKPADLAVRVIPVKYVSASDLAQNFSSVYRRLGSATDQIREISAHSVSNSLIVLSTRRDYEEIKELVTSLDLEEAEENVMEIIPLENADAEDLSEQLTDLYDEGPGGQNSYYSSSYYYYRFRYGDQQEKKAQFVPDRRRNALIVLAPPNAMDKIKAMIKTLDAPVEGEELVPLILPLKYVRAIDVEDVLNTLFLKKTQQRSYYYWDEWEQEEQDIGRLYGKVRITSETYTNSLIVASNSQENLDAIEKLVKQLDVSSPNGETTLSFPLKYARASAVANDVNILFAQLGAGPRRPTPQQQQQQARNQPQQQNVSASDRGFELAEEVAEEVYYPWLGGNPQQARQTVSGRTVRTGSDLVGKVRVVPDTRTNSLLITTNAHLFPPVVKLVSDLDTPTAQVLIEARVIEILQEDALRLGTRWSPDGAQVFDADDLDDSFLGEVGAEYLDVFGSGLVQANINLDVLMQFLKKNTDTRILSSPRVNVADNERGKLFIGSRIPFIENSQLTPQGGQNNSFQYIDVGITLEVTPRINTENEVALGIRVETSKVREGETLFGGAIIDTRNYRTELTAQTGQTVVLGGMIQQVQQEIVRKVPILGDIPLLGWFFKKKDTVMADFEIMVFLQPQVTRTPQEAQRLKEEEERRARRIFRWRRETEERLQQEDEERRLEDEGNRTNDQVPKGREEGPLPRRVDRSELAGK